MTTDDLEQSLLQALAPDDLYPIGGDEDRPPEERWRVTDDGAAGWCMRKLRDAQDQISRVDALYAEELAKLDAWRDHQHKTPAATVARMTGYLEDYMRRRRAEDPTCLSFAVPGGYLSSTRSYTVEITDPAALLAWARAFDPALVTSPPAPDPFVSKTAVRGVLLADPQTGDTLPAVEGGEIVPGIRVENKVNVKVAPA